MNNLPDSIKVWIAGTKAHHRILFNIGILALGIVLIFGMNLLIARNFIGGTDFYINWSSAQQLHTEEQNPYYTEQGFLLVKLLIGDLQRKYRIPDIFPHPSLS